MTKTQKQVLATLADGQRWRESEIGASNRTLQNMYYAGWVTGAGYPDKKGTGNYPDTREWWITDKGREALAATARGTTP